MVRVRSGHDTRMTVLSLCGEHGIPHEIRDVPEAEIHEADEVFCTGTMGEIVAVTRIDETVYCDEQPGPMTLRLASLYRELTKAEGFQIVDWIGGG